MFSNLGLNDGFFVCLSSEFGLIPGTRFIRPVYATRLPHRNGGSPQEPDPVVENQHLADCWRTFSGPDIQTVQRNPYNCFTLNPPAKESRCPQHGADNRPLLRSLFDSPCFSLSISFSMLQKQPGPQGLFAQYLPVYALQKQTGLQTGCRGDRRLDSASHETILKTKLYLMTLLTPDH